MTETQIKIKDPIDALRAILLSIEGNVDDDKLSPADSVKKYQLIYQFQRALMVLEYERQRWE